MDYNNKPILITGISGFIGTNLAIKLLEKNFVVHGIIRKNSNTWRIKNIIPKLHLHYCNLSEEKKLSSILKKVKPFAIFHLATFNDYRTVDKVNDLVSTNIIGTINLLKASQNIKYKTLVVTGSSSEYGLKKSPMKEKDFLEPISFYAATKASATFISQVFARTFNKPICIFRLFSVYGPYEEGNRLIPTAIKAALEKKILPLTTGIVKRDFIYVEDVVDAYIKTIYNSLPPGEIINIGTGKQYSNEDVIKIIESVIKKKIKIKKKSFKNRPWDTDTWVSDNKKAKKILSWKPKYNLQAGIDQTIQWSKNFYEKNKYIS